MIDKEAIEAHIRGILTAIGEDPDREGLRETPERVARMYEEVFAGIAKGTNKNHSASAPTADEIMFAAIDARTVGK